MNQIQKMIDRNDILKQYINITIEELKLIRMYINLDLICIKTKIENQLKISITTSGKNKINSYLTNILDFRYDIDREKEANNFILKIGKDYSSAINVN